MRIMYAFLAKAMQAAADGTLHLLGAGFDAIEVPTLPTTLSPMALIAKCVEESGVPESNHVLQIQVENPSGNIQSTTKQHEIKTARKNVLSATSPAATLTVMFVFAVKTEGQYLIHLLIDGSRAATIPIHATLNKSQVVPADISASNVEESAR